MRDPSRIGSILLVMALAFGAAPHAYAWQASPGQASASTGIEGLTATQRLWLLPQEGAGVMNAACCKKCSKGKACGDSCISRDKTCRKGVGCACD